jgi:tRNA nucleotidyltransferase/poly(A) polymerase
MDSSTRPIILELLSFSACQNKKLFVVGGTLRDYLSRKPCTDFDLTGKNAAEIGINFSHHLNFKYVPLDNTPNRKTVRVILDQNQHLDFTDLQGNNIEEDLSQRDFTINAMGQLLADFLGRRRNIIDPHNGQEDLKNKVIRVLPGPIFKSDPLRMLRAFRFAATLGFDIDEETLIKISQHKSLMTESAQERVWHELSLFFKTPHTKSLLDLLHSSGILNCFFSTTEKGYSYISDHYQRLENLIQEQDNVFPEHKDELRLNSFDYKSYLLKISVFLKEKNLSNETKIKSSEILFSPSPLDPNWNLRPSNEEIKFLDQTLNGAWHLSQMYVKKSSDLEEIFELTHTIHEELLASVFLFRSEFQSTDEDPVHFCNLILNFYFQQYLPTMNKTPLLNGADIIQKFNISPSPLIGKILHCVQKEHVLGNIATQEDAIALANKLIQS